MQVVALYRIGVSIVNYKGLKDCTSAIKLSNDFSMVLIRETPHSRCPSEDSTQARILNLEGDEILACGSSVVSAASL